MLSFEECACNAGGAELSLANWDCKVGFCREILNSKVRVRKGDIGSRYTIRKSSEVGLHHTSIRKSSSLFNREIQLLTPGLGFSTQPLFAVFNPSAIKKDHQNCNRRQFLCFRGFRDGPHMAAVPSEDGDLQGRTYYDVLGLPPPPVQLSQQEIKAAYHRALLNSHPDKVSGINGHNVSLVRDAWTVLSNDTLRKEYDRKIEGKYWVLGIIETDFRYYKKCFRFRRPG